MRRIVAAHEHLRAWLRVGVETRLSGIFTLPCTKHFLETQRQAIQDECRRRGWKLLRVETDALSGKTTKRPGLQAALDACRSGEASGVVVMKLDRLTRSIVDFGRLLEEAPDKRRGFNIVALDLGVDLSTPGGELVGNVMASVAQWERRAIGQRTKDALAVKREQGVKLGRPRTMPASVRRRIERERANGQSLSAIAASLNASRVPTAHGGAKWRASTVRKALQARSAAWGFSAKSKPPG